ncbi:hypothetical protein CYMTET_39770 [Cymbomonas tetramitiformis]|uniref:Uncharacterized protein n=1 Tax=Cymbomonas tetramitiformis TaxID=36881 RepID=A0AAE0CBG4_9CHLO|nr:hypothetical protein CYMTET_39770 [Cymbomonas tetramitiformis]
MARSLLTLAVLFCGIVFAECDTLEHSAARKLLNAQSRAAKASRSKAAENAVPPFGMGYPGMSATGFPGAHMTMEKTSDGRYVAEAKEDLGQYEYNQAAKNQEISSLQEEDEKEHDMLNQLHGNG